MTAPVTYLTDFLIASFASPAAFWAFWASPLNLFRGSLSFQPIGADLLLGLLPTASFGAALSAVTPSVHKQCTQLKPSWASIVPLSIQLGQVTSLIMSKIIGFLI